MPDQPFTVLMPDILDNPDIERSELGAGYRVIAPKVMEAGAITDELWAKTDAIMAWHDLLYPEELLNKMPSCKVIVRNGVGYDNVDLQATGRLGIVVCNVPDYGTDVVADHSVACLLALARGLPMYTESVRSGHWTHGAAVPLRRLSETTLGIIGLGRIGTATALRAKAFGMEVCFYDPYLPDGADKALGISRSYELTELLAQADAVSVHAPLTEETRNMANAEFFAAMKPGSLFINTARGSIVDVAALADALRSGHLRGAAMDVWPTEPAFDEPLVRAWCAGEPWIADRLIVTPHAAFYCEESIREIRVKSSREVKRVLSGEPPRNCVNTQWLSCCRAGDAIFTSLRRT